MTTQHYVLMAAIVGVYLLHRVLIAGPRKLHAEVAGRLTLGQTYRMRVVCETLKGTVQARNDVKIARGHYEVSVYLKTDDIDTKLTLLGGDRSQLSLSIGPYSVFQSIKDKRKLEDYYLECLATLIEDFQISDSNPILNDAKLIGAAMTKRGWRKK